MRRRNLVYQVGDVSILSCVRCITHIIAHYLSIQFTKSCMNNNRTNKYKTCLCLDHLLVYLYLPILCSSLEATYPFLIQSCARCVILICSRVISSALFGKLKALCRLPVDILVNHILLQRLVFNVCRDDLHIYTPQLLHVIITAPAFLLPCSF